jgi:hypothetical protein
MVLLLKAAVIELQAIQATFEFMPPVLARRGQ